MKKALAIISITLSCSGSYPQTINAKKLETVISKAEQFNSDALIIYCEDQLIVEKYFTNDRRDSVIETMSCTKSIVALAVICLLDDGLIDSLETPVHIYYPEWNSSQKKQITIKHLLNMTSGIQNGQTTEEIYNSENFIDLALKADLTEMPGEKFRYNNKAVNLLAGIIQKITGHRMDIYIQERLFEPMNIEYYKWILDESGNPHAMSGCQLKPSDFVKIGLLISHDGSYNGNQIVSKKNILMLFEPSEKNHNYGLLWWLNYERTIFAIKDEIIAEIKSLGASENFISTLSTLMIEFNSKPKYYLQFKSKILSKWWNFVEVIGPSNLKNLYETVTPENQIFYEKSLGGIQTYEAAGWLGNYLIIDPKTKIVALRMISYNRFNHGDGAGIGQDNYYDFRKDVANLTNP